MAEKIVSPGVFTKEIDASFLPAAIGDIGAAVVGPTVKGPAMIPTVVSSYSEYQAIFGDSFKSGSSQYQYLTSVAAENYLKHSGKLTVVRILDDTYGGADASITSTSTTGTSFASASLHFDAVPTGSSTGVPNEIVIGGVDFTFVSSSVGYDNSSTQIFVPVSTGSVDGDQGPTTGSVIESLARIINASSSLHGLSISASYNFGGGNSTGNVAGDFVRISGSSAGVTGNITVTTGSDNIQLGYVVAGGGADGLVLTDAVVQNGFNVQGGIAGTTTTTSFKLNTKADGAIMNNQGTVGQTNNILLSGSKDNVRWEVSSKNNAKGTFTLLVRRGDDTIKQKQILETWNNLSLDPNESNYISKVIGDSKASINNTDSNDPFIEYTGNYPNKSKYVYVSNVSDTPDYLDENGNIRENSLSASLPTVGSGSSDGGFANGVNGAAGFDALGNVSGTYSSKYNFYNDIDASNSQGYDLTSTTAQDGGSAYIEALNLLANADEYDINLLLVPGIMDNLGDAHTGIITKAIDVAESRGDCFVIYDSVEHSVTNLTTVTGKVSERDSNYAATYWPWVQINDSQTGAYRWVPPSTVMAGIYAFNDKGAAPWFAPAGLNRGGLDTVIQASRKLTHANRDTLYESNVNPIATFPGQGVVVWGQKTLQKKSSALDRVNVRRLMIKVKKFIAASSRFLVFEQNNATTRERFLNIANPYLEQVQAQSGLNAFKVVMDETNNTPDIVDRNILYGQIFLQPTKTAEFIVLGFTIQPTGATFPE